MDANLLAKFVHGIVAGMLHLHSEGLVVTTFAEIVFRDYPQRFGSKESFGKDHWLRVTNTYIQIGAANQVKVVKRDKSCS